MALHFCLYRAAHCRRLHAPPPPPPPPHHPDAHCFAVYYGTPTCAGSSTLPGHSTRIIRPTFFFCTQGEFVNRYCLSCDLFLVHSLSSGLPHTHSDSKHTIFLLLFSVHYHLHYLCLACPSTYPFSLLLLLWVPPAYVLGGGLVLDIGRLWDTATTSSMACEHHTPPGMPVPLRAFHMEGRGCQLGMPGQDGDGFGRGLSSPPACACLVGCPHTPPRVDMLWRRHFPPRPFSHHLLGRTCAGDACLQHFPALCRCRSKAVGDMRVPGKPCLSCINATGVRFIRRAGMPAAPHFG